MPIVDVEIVVGPGEQLPGELAAALADAIGRVLNAPAESVWVKLRTLADACYAENSTAEPLGRRAVFVRMLQARRPTGHDLEQQARELVTRIAEVCGRQLENVHILFEPDAMGRIAFGGELRK
jgi:phenylpyruvate tautomerase PptA (4-oxalocrotonate tautomerase family)